MTLPPEHINIKRRREEEPVDTLYIQSELHQTKRRFTDFVFQRVTVNAGSVRRSDSPSPSGSAAAQRSIRSPRSVSNLHVRKTTNIGGGGVPLVRATSPGAELREEQRITAARRQAEEKLKNATYSSPSPLTPGSEKTTTTTPKVDATPNGERLGSSTPSEPGSPASRTGIAPSIRRFQISRPGAPPSPLRTTGGGIQKRKDGAVAVLVEKLRREPHSRRASMVAGAASGRLEDMGFSIQEPMYARPQKRPVVNQTEKKWREERQGAISAAKERISQVLERGAQAHRTSWEDESDRLARQFEQIALELDGDMEVVPSPPNQHSPSSMAARSAMPKPPLKYQPRTPNRHRAAAPPDPIELNQKKTARAAATEENPDSDEDYVYDMYIRRPLPDRGFLTDPVVNLELDQEAWLRHHGIDGSRQDIGVIVITPEDEIYWEDFAEEDEEDRWDSEDGDSNGKPLHSNTSCWGRKYDMSWKGKKAKGRVLDS
ncbi:uncharacterized protein BJX67DRAFT_138523 [Aspergillus lucknowensis]|uniref:Transcription factor Iwr1 domain-containing protein n=1 Tax=Aspergillus lucknowensis TaxID=176173 RepID=A0ABR4LPE4_9EURO